VRSLVEVVDAGMATTIQDTGRPGLAHLAVPTSGAVDPALLAVLNRLLGNPVDAAAFETCGNLTVRALSSTVVATSTEPVPVSLHAGDVCTVRPDGRRLWHYVAVRGGIAVPPVLGSRSRDTLSALGPGPIRRGDVVPIGPEPDAAIVADLAPLAEPSGVARIVPGPRADWFAPDWPDRIVAGPWTVTATSRIGVRLRGRVLDRVVAAELPSEGLVRGAIQVPPDGDPVMMLADHPTTGGYPVIAVVDPDDVATVAQHSAGTTLRLRM
jgi:biotin-dependent carboxylase-like uncharacterized protein